MPEALLEVTRCEAQLLVQREGGSEDPAGAGDHRVAGPAPAPQGAGCQRHRQPEADRDAPGTGHGGAGEGERNARQAVIMADEAQTAGKTPKVTELTAAAESFATRSEERRVGKGCSSKCGYRGAK